MVAPSMAVNTDSKNKTRVSIPVLFSNHKAQSAQPRVKLFIAIPYLDCTGELDLVK